MRAILYGIPFSALLSQVRTTENHLFAQKVLFFCSKKMYNVVGMCSFLLFVGDFRDLSAKFAIAIYPREGTKTTVPYSVCPVVSLQFIPARGRKQIKAAARVGRRALQFIPARGRKRFFRGSTNVVGKLQFIPARGRKPEAQDAAGLLPYCNLSPRGDENPMAKSRTNMSELLQFIPARGRKP